MAAVSWRATGRRIAAVHNQQARTGTKSGNRHVHLLCSCWSSCSCCPSVVLWASLESGTRWVPDQKDEIVWLLDSKSLTPTTTADFSIKRVTGFVQHNVVIDTGSRQSSLSRSAWRTATSEADRWSKPQVAALQLLRQPNCPRSQTDRMCLRDRQRRRRYRNGGS